MANTIFQLLSDFFARYGYWVVFFGVMAENIGMPVPGETVLLFAGFLAYQGQIHLVPAILIAIAGATAGACFGYWLGWHGGPAVVNRLLRRFPRLRKRYDESQKKFLKHGQWAVFTSRFIVGLRMFAGVMAGVLRMPFFSFLLYSFAGAVCWALVIGYVGFMFGSNWAGLVHFMGRVNRIAWAIIGAGAAVTFLVYLIRRKKEST